ncbi:restriction endonuclease subunit S [Candidatus Pelagibacter sp.]|nr:restriction endonuclease subunit S [Candidatus Pelagibacter sp.]MDC3395453.1 restriction endonuclease subunit S [Candidatus Pelagibacter sp.]
MNIKTLTIDELCNIDYGTRVTRKKDGGKTYPVYGGGGKTFFLDKTNRNNQLVIARFGMSEKCTRFVKGNFFLNDSGLTLSPKTNELSQQYLDKFILTLNDSIYKLGKGTAQKNLDMKQFRLLKISFPKSLKDQQHIVAILDAIFTEIEKYNENIFKSKNYSKDLTNKFLNNLIIKKEYGWEEKTFPEICINLDNERIPIKKSKRIEGKIPYYGASGVVDYVKDWIFDDNLLLVSEDGANLVMRTYPIAFNVNGKCWVNNHAHVLKFKDKKLQYWVEKYLNSMNLRNYISGMAQPKLNQAKLNAIKIPIPKFSVDELIKKIQIFEKNFELYNLIALKKKNLIDSLKLSFLRTTLNKQV